MPTSPCHHSPTPSTSSTASLTPWTSKIPHIFRSIWKYWSTPTPPTSPLLWDGPISPFSWQIWSELLGGTPPRSPVVDVASAVPAIPDAVAWSSVIMSDAEEEEEEEEEGGKSGSGERLGWFETAPCSPASASHSVSCRTPPSPTSISASSLASATSPTTRISPETASIIAALSRSDNKIKYSQLHAFEATWSAKWQVFTCPYCYSEAFTAENEEEQKENEE